MIEVGELISVFDVNHKLVYLCSKYIYFHKQEKSDLVNTARNHPENTGSETEA